MLSLSDFKEKQILFIQSEKGQKCEIKFWNDNVRFMKEGEVINQLSCHKILAIFILGDLTITTVLIKKCLQYGVSLFLLKNNFLVYATIGSSAEGNYLLRMKQYNFQDELGLARQVVNNKIYNQWMLLAKENKEKKLSDNFCKIEEKIKNTKDEKTLLGIEGDLTKKFFVSYFSEINWHKRMPQTKIDINNVLLDMGYTYLFNFIDTLLRLHGFDTYKGFYHKLFFQRKSLSCDLMEPFRCLIDKQLTKSYHLKQIDEKDFKFNKGRYELSYDKQLKYSKIFLECILNYKEDIFQYIKQFYVCVLNETKEYPFFKLK